MKKQDIIRKVSNWIEQEDRFCDLILTPDGDLFFDENLEACADWFMLYHNGWVCIRPSGHLYCLGALPCCCEIFPVHVEDTVIQPDNDGGCVLRSNFPDLDFDISTFTVFQYGEMLGSYTADTTYSEKILFRMSVNTPQNRDLAIKVFLTQLNHYNPKLCKRIEAWLKGHGTSWKGD